jgi:hypothetical protein
MERRATAPALGDGCGQPDSLRTPKRAGYVESRGHSGVDRYPYGFNLTGQPLVSFASVTRASAEAAAEQVRSAIEHAVEVRPHPPAG